MKTSRCFWVAASLSVVFHAVALAVVLASMHLVVSQETRQPSLPILVVAYGDSDRVGLAVDAVAQDAGTLRQGDANTPGSDGTPTAPADQPSKPADPPKADKPAPPIPPPPPMDEKPPVVASPPQSPAPDPVADKPANGGEPRAADPSPPVKPAPTPSGDNTTKGAAAAATSGQASLPGAPGGSRLPLGTPSAGGKTAGSVSSVRVADGARPPVYPPEAREEGLEGTPVIWLRVSAEGAVLDAKVQQSCGYKVLDAAALNWARSQKFIPASRDGAPVEAEVTKPVRFYLY